MFRPLVDEPIKIRGLKVHLHTVAVSLPRPPPLETGTDPHTRAAIALASGGLQATRHLQDGVCDAFTKRLAETAGAMKVADGFEPGAVIGPLD